MDSGVLGILGFFVLFVVLDVAALRFGCDSRSMKGAPVRVTSARQRAARLDGSTSSAVAMPPCSITGNKLRIDAAAHS